MIRVKGDLFAACDWGRSGVLVIPINIGWKRDGANPMGTGVAAAAAGYWTDLPRVAGQACQAGKGEMGVRGVWGVKSNPMTDGDIVGRFVLFPTKPLNPAAPHLSWKSPATLERVEQSAAALAIRVITADWFPGYDYYLPLVGCGSGGLRREDVLPILDRYLESDRFVLVER